ncbi:hypothetical protein AB0N17_03340 [Streptomyces sp. NPDC051133]|uniref:hypothetical protein n=1 Tax=Streptomyces sp. NPDC051133 TaxID=3155521 RepID=UPI0034303D4C
MNHRDEAERLLASLDTSMTAALEGTLPIEDQQHAAVLTGILTNRALAHAALAQSATTTADVMAYRHTIQTMRFALIRQVAEGLALSEGDEAHLHARGLSQYLDSVGLNVDLEVDAYIEGHCGYSDARDAWLSPTERRAKRDAEPTPWDNPPA